MIGLTRRPRHVEGAWVLDVDGDLQGFPAVGELEPFDNMKLRRVRRPVIVDEGVVREPIVSITNVSPPS